MIDKNLNAPAYPTNVAVDFQGLTKLELVSTIVLQGIIANQTFPILSTEQAVEKSITLAKELLISIERSESE